MAKRIIVAGGGHGGIACANLLARAGFAVTVYEKNTRENMGYDWTDIFDPKSLALAGLPFPNKDQYAIKNNMTFVPPSGRVKVTQDVPDDKAEIKMERRDIYDLLIRTAEESGVQFVFDCAVLSPLLSGDRVIGIATDKGDFTADLVIDACGCESPVRAGLPDCCGIQKHPAKYEKFYVYRAFYNCPEGTYADDKYKVYLLPNGRLGIGWVANEGDYTDLLIGEFEPFTVAQAEEKAAFFRRENPVLGSERLRGGQMVQIPVRQPLSIIVADGYAAIGDSAFMTVPIIGSGIANTFRAAKMLAETVISDSTETYSAETLWDYQRTYYKELGAGLAPLALVKLMLTKISPQQLDYMFETKMLTVKDLTITADSTSLSDFIHIDAGLLGKGVSLIKDRKLTMLIASLGKSIAETAAVCAAMPRHYSRYAVLQWAKKYDAIFQ